MCSEPTRLTHLDASGAGEGRLGVHEPVLPPQRREMGGEGPPIAQAVEITEEGQPGRRVGRHCRAPQLGLDDDPEPSLMMPGIIISLIFSEQGKLVLRATPLQY